jgi:hypothetical protein
MLKKPSIHQEEGQYGAHLNKRNMKTSSTEEFESLLTKQFQQNQKVF